MVFSHAIPWRFLDNPPHRGGGHLLDQRVKTAIRLSRALHREVDLIDLQDVAGEILQQSLCQGTNLLQKDAGLYARLMQRLWFEQAEVMPYRWRILAERRRRFLDG
jgi:hypothetical protein